MRGLGPRSRSLLLGLATVALARSAQAYVRTSTDTGHAMRWPNPPSISIDLYTVNPPPYLDRDTLVAAVEAAAATWSKPTLECTDLLLSVNTVDEETAPVDYDGTNRITFRRDSWRKMPCDPAKEICGLYDPRAIALTSVFARKSDGRIIDSDMELNAVNFVWADVVRDGPNIPDSDRQLHDLQNVVTHELGHLIGLDHNCYDPAANPRGRPNDQQGAPVSNCEGASASIRSATMFNSAARRDVSKRDLTPDDIEAVCDIYPLGAGDDKVTGGCSLAGPTAAHPRREPMGTFPLLALAGGVTFGMARRRRSASRR